MAVIDILKEIEKRRGTRVVVYFLGDRQGANSRISTDAVSPIFDLLNLACNGKPGPVDLILFTLGGDVSVPWRVNSMIREFTVDSKYSVLIPYKAYSAGTMIALGADEIVMGRKAELGPIDPTLQRMTPSQTGSPSEISVEDVSSYISFIRNRANITDQAALSHVVGQLANSLSPLVLGSVNRMHSHIRLVARKLLNSRIDKIEEDKASSIIDLLTEKMYSHGHAIGRKEARELDLPVLYPDDELENLLWELYCEYETLMSLNDPLYPDEEFNKAGADEVTLNDLPVGVIESTDKRYVFRTTTLLARRRQIPPNPQIQINMPIALPQNAIGPGGQPVPGIQQIIQQLQQNLAAAIPGLVKQQIANQSPVIGFEMRSYGGKWKVEKP